MPFDPEKDLIAKYLSKPSKRRSGIPMTMPVKFIVAHDTGNPGSTASGNVRYYENSRHEISASAHIFVDDKEIIECIPALTGQPEVAYHVRKNMEQDNILYGVNANDAAIGIEYCYGGKIKSDDAYKKYVSVIAFAIKKFNLPPKGAVVGHYFLDPCRKTDPLTGLADSRRTYDQLLKDVEAEYLDQTGGAQNIPLNIHPQINSIITTSKLNLRKNEPSTRTDIVNTVSVGTKLEYIGWTDDGERINGVSKWYKTPEGYFFWSGGVM
ncbi:MAG: N-acetylmuramoyl-L-alanine amidase [Chlorobiaceae bacterium]|nr:N-acetylmuramoyl-L-alanine amidase [Chlorobiaceae bacterium]